MAIDLRLDQDAAVWGPSPTKPLHQTNPGSQTKIKDGALQLPAISPGK